MFSNALPTDVREMMLTVWNTIIPNNLSKFIYHYLFTYLFIFEILEIQFIIHYEESEAAIHKN